MVRFAMMDPPQKWLQCDPFQVPKLTIHGHFKVQRRKKITLSNIIENIILRNRNLPDAYLLEYHQKLVLFPLEHILGNMNNHLEDLTDIQMRLVSKLVKSESESSSCYDLGLQHTVATEDWPLSFNSKNLFFRGRIGEVVLKWKMISSACAWLEYIWPRSRIQTDTTLWFLTFFLSLFRL